MAHFFTRFTFIGGFFVGVALAIIILLMNSKPPRLNSLENLLNAPFANHYETWFSNNNFKRFNVSFDLLRYTNHKYLLESQLLYSKVKIGCVIIVHNVNNTKAAKETWTKHCNSLNTLSMTGRKMPANRQGSSTWFIMCNYLQSLPIVFDWFLIVTDDTFVLLENIRYFVAGLDSKKPYYLGHAVTFWGVTYNSGQAGYLLNNATVAALKNKYLCKADFTLFNLEDYYLGKALFGLNITPSDTRDNSGLSTFHGFNLMKLFFPGSTFLTNYYKFSAYPIKCCSYNSVTFKVSSSDQMFTYEYLLHQLQIFKYGQYGNIIPTTHKPEDEIWQSFLKHRGIAHRSMNSEQYYKLWEDIMQRELRSHIRRS